MICGYCEKEITDGKYMYKWIPTIQRVVPVHTYHLNATRNMQKGMPYKPLKKEGGV